MILMIFIINTCNELNKRHNMSKFTMANRKRKEIFKLRASNSLYNRRNNRISVLEVIKQYTKGKD